MTFQANRIEATAPQAAAVSIWDSFHWVLERLGAFSRQIIQRKHSRRLRLCETVSLGNRGFVAVIGYQEQRFLVGGTSTSIVLLAQLHALSDLHLPAPLGHSNEGPGKQLRESGFAEKAQLER